MQVLRHIVIEDTWISTTLLMPIIDTHDNYDDFTYLCTYVW